MGDKFQLKALITGVDKLSPTLAGIRKNVAGFKKSLDKTGLGKLSFGDVVRGGALAAPFILGAKAAIDYESQMADVRKVVDFDSPAQFKQMGDDIEKMSEKLPMAAGEIAKIVAAGGQSGIARDELLGFAEAAVKMGIAFDQTAEQSGEMMAKWRTAFKMSQVEVTGLADKINYLGNTGPANTKQISDIVTRIGPLGEIAGLASGQIAALGATMAGVGVEQEVAATGIKNFMLAMTKGSAATKSQAQAFKSLRPDSKKVAKSMQQDAQGTILDLLDRVQLVDPAARAGLLTQLFGSESVTAISPLLTNLDLLKSNLKKVSDEKKFGGSMDAEYASRAATTANNLQLLRGATENVARAIGAALLPGINQVVDQLRPFVSRVADVIKQNPNLVKGLAAAGVTFGVLTTAGLAAATAIKIASFAFGATPIGLIATAIALAAGLIIANWDTVGPFFVKLWDGIKGPAMVLWGWFKQAFAFTPLGLVIENWGPLTEFFKAIWGVLVAISGPAWDFIKHMFDWSPLGIIIRNWEPITAWFKGLWETIKPIIEPILKFMGAGEGGDGIIQTATNKANAFAEEQRKRNAGEGGGTGDFLRSDAAKAMQDRQSLLNQTQGGASASALLRPPGQMPAPGSLLQQTAAANAQSLKGQIDINLKGAPPGSTVEESKSNQRGLTMKPNVGQRTVGAT